MFLGSVQCPAHGTVWGQEQPLVLRNQNTLDGQYTAACPGPAVIRIRVKNLMLNSRRITHI